MDIGAAFIGGTEVAWLGGGLAIGLLVGRYLAWHNKRPAEPKLPPRIQKQNDKRYVLVVANQTLSGEALRREIVHRSSSLDTEVEIVCPVLNGEPPNGAGSEDEAKKRAHQSLERMLNQIRSAGLVARGRIGSADPIRTLSEAMYRFPADEVIISTHPYGHSNWLERDLVEYARNRFPVPVTHVIVDLEHEKSAEQ